MKSIGVAPIALYVRFIRIKPEKMISEERGYEFLVPENLDIPALLKANEELVTKYEIKEERLRWFCDLLLNQRASQRKRMIDDKTEYVNLSSELMQQAFRDYGSHIDFLEDTGVIDINKKYFSGEYCRGYRFTSLFNGVKINSEKIEDRKLIRSIQRQERRFKRHQKVLLRGYKHLMVGFDSDLLDIDLPAANEWIENYLAEQLAELNPKSKSYEEKWKIVHDTAHDFKLQVLKIKEKKYSCLFSGKGHRFYSIISNLKRELREFLTYNGETLVEVDVKNCQPFLALNLFRKDFWLKDLRNSKLLNFSKIDKNLYREWFTEEGIDKHISILVKSYETQSEQGSQLKLFMEKVLEGKFYEYIMSEFSKEWPNRFKDRKATKIGVLTMFFDDPAKEEKYYSPSHGFKKLFPEVYQLFRLIQSIDYRVLANLLQRIESYLILDKAARAVSKQYNGIPMFPIHDSILTLAEYAETVKSVMEEQIEAFTGYKPIVEVKSWKSIPGYENEYKINTKGEVKSVERSVAHRTGVRMVKERILATRIDNQGYETVRLWKDGIESTKFVHRLLALTFLSNTLNHLQVNHKNGVKSDNRLKNLEWVTPSENTIHAYRNNLIKVKRKKVVDNCSGEIYESCLDAALSTGRNYNTLRGYLSGRKDNPTCLQYEAA